MESECLHFKLVLYLRELLFSQRAPVEYLEMLVFVADVALLVSKSNLPGLVQVGQVEVLILCEDLALNLVIEQAHSESKLSLYDESILKILL